MKNLVRGFITFIIGMVCVFCHADSLTLEANSCLCELSGQTKCLDEKQIEHEFNEFVSICAGEPAVVTQKHYFSENNRSVVLEFESLISFYEKQIMSMIPTNLFMMPKSEYRDKEIAKGLNDALDYHLDKCLLAIKDPAVCNRITKSISQLYLNIELF